MQVLHFRREPKVIVAAHRDPVEYHFHTGMLERYHVGARGCREEARIAPPYVGTGYRSRLENAIFTSFGRAREVCRNCSRFMSQPGCHSKWNCCGRQRDAMGCTKYFVCRACGKDPKASGGCVKLCSSCSGCPYKESPWCDHSKWAIDFKDKADDDWVLVDAAEGEKAEDEWELVDISEKE